MKPPKKCPVIIDDKPCGLDAERVTRPDRESENLYRCPLGHRFHVIESGDESKGDDEGE
jgi:hypothetical protein